MLDNKMNNKPLNNIELISIFNKNIDDFLDTLISHFPKDHNFILLKILLNTGRINYDSLLISFADTLIPNKQLILDKNPDFFITKCSHIFKDINQHISGTDTFKRVWMSPRLTEEEREILWRWFKLFLNISIEYKT
jgi:hypothetical protein